MEPDPVEISRTRLIQAYQQLEVVVPSLDRIGSAYPHQSSERAAALLRFVEDWRIGPRLAEARGILAEALRAGLTEDESLMLDDLLTQPVWEQQAPEPPSVD